MLARKGEIIEGAVVALEMTPFDFEKARISDVVTAGSVSGS